MCRIVLFEESCLGLEIIREDTDEMSLLCVKRDAVPIDPTNFVLKKIHRGGVPYEKKIY
jgi:hypothetical protein